MKTRNEKIAEAAEKLDASRVKRGWIYLADETGEWYLVTTRDLAELSDLMHSEDEVIARDAYNHWCNGCGKLIRTSTAERWLAKPERKPERKPESGICITRGPGGVHGGGNNMTAFAETLRAARGNLGLSRTGASTVFRIPLRTWEDWEASRRTPPKWAQKLLLTEMNRRAPWEKIAPK